MGDPNEKNTVLGDDIINFNITLKILVFLPCAQVT